MLYQINIYFSKHEIRLFYNFLFIEYKNLIRKRKETISFGELQKRMNM